MIKIPKIIIIISLYSCIIGILDLIGGASYQSLFYTIDNIIVKVIGLIFIISGWISTTLLLGQIYFNSILYCFNYGNCAYRRLQSL